MKMKCDTCLKSRPIISENGIHYICCLSSRSANNCISGKKDKYISIVKKDGDPE